MLPACPVIPVPAVSVADVPAMPAPPAGRVPGRVSCRPASPAATVGRVSDRPGLTAVFAAPVPAPSGFTAELPVLPSDAATAGFVAGRESGNRSDAGGVPSGFRSSPGLRPAVGGNNGDSGARTISGRGGVVVLPAGC